MVEAAARMPADALAMIGDLRTTPRRMVGAVRAVYRAAGANGFGLGSALYKPGQNAAATASHARAYINGLRIARAGAKK